MNHEQRFMIWSFLLLLLQSCISIDTITLNRPISDGDVLVSSGESFALGFFSPGRSRYRYVGIWYHKISEQTVVWVANRDRPINDTTGILSINQAGNLVLHAQNIVLWSSNVSVTSTRNCTAQLLDSGNLVLVQSQTKRVMWKSFDYPTHTVLPGMKLGLDRTTGLNRFLTSWKSSDDPGIGSCSYRFDARGSSQLFLWKGPVQRWRTGPWNGLRWSGVPEMTHYFNLTVRFVDNQEESYVMYTMFDASVRSRLAVDESGSVQWLAWVDSRWILFWSAPKDRCDYYGRCGSYGSCNPNSANGNECTCLPGYEPNSPSNGSGGCVRKRVESSTCGNGDGFVKVERVKVPDTSMARVDPRMSLKACEQECLRKCSCKAYTIADIRGSGCITWYGDLTDTREYSSGGQDLYIRVDAIELAQHAKKYEGFFHKKGMLEIVVMSIIVNLFLMIFFTYRLVLRKRKGRQGRPKFLINITTGSTSFEDSSRETELDEGRTDPNLHLFKLSTIVAATDNFSLANKLGEGGFGSVYKGHLVNGQEIAVKRLSKNSGQGIEEFKNEVTLIAKLQHRNLVRLFGCCIHREERMLIYEHLPNKSLDSFIFDKSRRALLDWRKRYKIIFGIARGVLYLHQDSRLRIIHRDLKASNVLLDAALNPKISDFGMARIFGGDQIEGKTKRVVGTYGYMSPEYAMRGLYSIKSDVFSFGVLLIEIICGRKNNDYFNESSSLNLIGHVWDLWREGKTLEIVDSSLGESYPPDEVLRYIQIGLLCVQECAEDRPTMSEVIFMLGNETTLPSPKQPAFIICNPNMSREAGACSVNDVTLTSIKAR